MTTIVPRHETGRVNPLSARPETARPSWEDRAACRGKNSRLWDDEAPHKDAAKARETCLGCPVLAQCLPYAMDSELGRGTARSGIKGGLTAKERALFQKQVWRGGPYDAEEARLLALESRVSGRPVKDIAAREGVTGSTVGLALRLSGAAVAKKEPPRPRAPRLSAAERASARIGDIVQWRLEGLSLENIAQQVGVNSHAVRDALVRFQVENPQVAFPSSKSRILERLEDIVAWRRQSLTWAVIDGKLGVSRGSTHDAVRRWRAKATADGVPIPVGLGPERIMTRELVVGIRERAARGERLVDLAREVGLSRTGVSKIVWGDTHRDCGGPIRERPGNLQSVAPSAASERFFNVSISPAAKKTAA